MKNETRDTDLDLLEVRDSTIDIPPIILQAVDRELNVQSRLLAQSDDKRSL